MDLKRLTRLARLIKRAQGYMGESIGPGRQKILEAIIAGKEIPFYKVLRVASSLPREKLIELMRQRYSPHSYGPEDYSLFYDRFMGRVGREELARALETAHIHGITNREILEGPARLLSKYEVSPMTMKWLKQVAPDLARRIEVRHYLAAPHPHHFEDIYHRVGRHVGRARYLPSYIMDKIIPDWDDYVYWNEFSFEEAGRRAAARAREMARRAAERAALEREIAMLRWGGRGALAGLGAIAGILGLLGYQKFKGRSTQQSAISSLSRYALPLGLAGVGGAGLLGLYLNRRGKKKKSRKKEKKK